MARPVAWCKAIVPETWPRVSGTVRSPSKRTYTAAISSQHLLTRRALARAALSVGLTVSHRALSQSPTPAWEDRTRKAVSELGLWAQKQRAQASALVLQIAGEREIAQLAPDAALNPASNQKVLTIAAAVDVLGPEYRFTTLLAGRQPGRELEALIVRSDGDPELSSADLGALADTLWERGDARTIGHVLVDQSAFDRQWDPPAYEQRPKDSAAYRAPVSAVCVDRNALTLHVLPTTPGQPAHVWFDPVGLVTSSGTITTTEPGSAQSVGLTVRARGSAVEALIAGKVPLSRGPLTFSRRIPNPEVAAGHVLAAKLRARGVVIQGSVQEGGADALTALSVRRSRPLSQIVHALGKSSDNFTAEMLLKALGRRHTSAQGSSAAGISVLEAYLRRQGAFTAGTRLTNGSGLFDANRVSTRTLCRVLARAHSDPRVGPELLASLAVGGVDGTLVNRFRGLRSQRMVRAKTGSLANVAALSGYVLTPSPRGPIAFALLLNDIAGKHAEARQRLDAVVEAIASP